MVDELKHRAEGVLVDESEPSEIDGDADRLIYRGYSTDCAASGADFEELQYPAVARRTARSALTPI